MMPVRLLLEQRDRTFADVIAALSCTSCDGNPAPVYLVAGQARTFMGGPSPDWTVELVAR